MRSRTVTVRAIMAILTSGAWVNASEFYRNEVLLRSQWVSHYASMYLSFPAAPVNGILWVLWGFLFAFALFILSRRFSVTHTALLAWLTGFLLMWIVAWNLGVLPVAILAYAVPLSALEAFVGALICATLAPPAAR